MQIYTTRYTTSKLFPLIINGILYRYSKDTAGLQLIPEGISTVKQYADSRLAREGNVYTKITGTNEELNKRANINLNLTFSNEVNCTNNQDLSELLPPKV